MLSGCVLWLRADLGVTTDGSDKVDAWADQSGAGNHFAQSTEANKPLHVASAYGSVDVIRGQDTNDHLEHNTSVSLGTAATIFFVLKQGSSASNYVLADSGPTNGVISRFSGALVEWFNGAGADRQTLANGPSGLNVYTIRQTNGSALQGWLNGSSAFGPVVPAAALTNIKSLLALNTGTNGSAAQDLAAVVVYQSALSDANRASVEDWLAARHGL